MIWHVWNLSMRDNPVPIMEALDKNVDIMRKTTLFDGRHPADGLNPPIPEWNALKAELASCIAAHDDIDTEPLEDACWTILEPYIAPRLNKAPKNKHPYGCWDYDVPDSKPHAIDIHFVNVYQPDSPFKAHKQDLIATLLQLIEEAVSVHPAVTTIQCESWLNQFELFAALFPPAWRASFVPIFNYLATNGWWGQYMDERGAFHEKRGREFRRTGTHPYSAGLCECDIRQVVDYLHGLFRCL
jgi:hypothetical protein